MDRTSNSIVFVRIIIIFMLSKLCVVDSYKILMVFPSHSHSHLIIGSSLLKGLAAAGHEVTMVSSFPQKHNITNYRDVYLEIPNELKLAFDETFTRGREQPMKPLRMMYHFIYTALDYSNSTMGLPEMRRMMREESFDLVITSIFGGRMQSGLAAHFKCPLAYIFPVKTTLNIAYMMGNPIQIASVPSMLSANRNTLKFFHRVQGFLVSVIEYTIFTVFDLAEWYYYNSNFPAPKYPTYLEASRNASLVLSAYHFSQGPVALLPQIVEIGGIQMDTKLMPLSNHLQVLLDSAAEGVIYFSFGTNVRLKKQNQMRLWSILRALEKTKMRVLMKYDTNDEIPGLSKNITTAEWLPQKEILAHPNVKLFISHGGLGGVMEAKYYGVPILGIPFFGDQPGNVRMAVKEGWAVELDFHKLNEQKVTRALQEVLRNTTYRKTVKEFSDVYRDRPLGPLKTAIYWVEYVIRHKGAPHMRSPATQMNFFQRNSLDVIAFLALVLYVIIQFIRCLIKGSKKVIKWFIKRNAPPQRAKKIA